MGTEITAWQPEGNGVDTVVSDRVLQRIADSVPASTRAAYASDWRQFAQWCDDTGRTALPCTQETLAEYASYMADAGKKPATIMRAVSAIRVIHDLGDYTPPSTRAARAIVKTYRNERVEAGLANETQATALSVRQLKKVAEALDGGTAQNARDRMIVVLGWAMMARRSELVRLNIADVTEVENGLEVMIRKAKADQMAYGRKVAVPYGSDPVTCPVRITRAWIALMAARGITSGPLIRRIDTADRIVGEPLTEALQLRQGPRGAPDGRLTGAGIWLIVKRVAERAGLDPNGIMAHSLRAGGATGAYLGGADLLSIGRHGGWHDGSMVLTRYIRDVDAWKKNPMHGAGL